MIGPASAAIAAAPLYVLAALTLLESAGLIDLVAPTSELPRKAAWAFAVLFAIGTLMNAISRSPKERRMSAVAGALAILSLLVALGS